MTPIIIRTLLLPARHRTQRVTEAFIILVTIVVLLILLVLLLPEINGLHHREVCVW